MRAIFSLGMAPSLKDPQDIPLISEALATGMLVLSRPHTFRHVITWTEPVEPAKIQLSLPEMRRMLWRVVLAVQPTAPHLLAWSRWRHWLQAVAIG
jgi:hypothetical protein